MRKKTIKRNIVIVMAAFVMIAPVFCCCLIPDADASSSGIVSLDRSAAVSPSAEEDCPMHRSSSEESTGKTKQCDCSGTPTVLNSSFHTVTLKSAFFSIQLSENFFIHAGTATADLSEWMLAADSSFYPHSTRLASSSIPLYIQNSILRL